MAASPTRASRLQEKYKSEGEPTVATFFVTIVHAAAIGQFPVSLSFDGNAVRPVVKLHLCVRSNPRVPSFFFPPFVCLCLSVPSWPYPTVGGPRLRYFSRHLYAIASLCPFAMENAALATRRSRFRGKRVDKVAAPGFQGHEARGELRFSFRRQAPTFESSSPSSCLATTSVGTVTDGLFSGEKRKGTHKWAETSRELVD